MKKTAINKFLKEFKKHKREKDIEEWLRIKISEVVEETYKEELEIADNRWKICEDKLKSMEE